MSECPINLPFPWFVSVQFITPLLPKVYKQQRLKYFFLDYTFRGLSSGIKPNNPGSS